MLNARRYLVLTILLAWGSADAAASLFQPPPAEIAPIGKPQLGRRERGPRVLVWYDDEKWHLRVKTDRQLHTFSGTIGVEGGKIVRLQGLEGLELGGKQGDVGVLNRTRTQIAFRFRTKRGADGIDFVLTPEATAVTFEVKYDGYEHPELIRIGAAGSAPPKARFTLPARPAAPTDADTQRLLDELQSTKPAP